MLSVIRYIVVVLCYKFAFNGTWVNNIHKILFVANVNQYCQLKRVPMHLLNFIKFLKNVIFGKNLQQTRLMSLERFGEKFYIVSTGIEPHNYGK
jgi:hypothetical protein